MELLVVAPVYLWQHRFPNDLILLTSRAVQKLCKAQTKPHKNAKTHDFMDKKNLKIKLPDPGIEPGAARICWKRAMLTPTPIWRLCSKPSMMLHGKASFYLNIYSIFLNFFPPTKKSKDPRVASVSVKRQAPSHEPMLLTQEKQLHDFWLLIKSDEIAIFSGISAKPRMK